MFSIASPAHAEWKASLLHPAGQLGSSVLGSFGSTQVGYAFDNRSSKASTWSGTAGSFASITSPGVSQAQLNGASATNFVGRAVIGSTVGAGLWDRGTNTFVDLNPRLSTWSEALATSGQTQAGWASFNSGPQKAILWSGTKESAVILGSGGSDQSQAYGVSATDQVGWQQKSGSFIGRAMRWTGSAASAIDLSGNAQSSTAFGTDGKTQVGFVTTQTSGDTGACLWTGTAASRVILHPVAPNVNPFGGSVAYSVSGAYQSGNVVLGFGANQREHASFWNGTKESWVDLHTILPDLYSRSTARTISVEGSMIYVGGFARNSITNQDEAVVWTTSTAVPEPSTFAAIGAGLAILRRRKRMASPLVRPL